MKYFIWNISVQHFYTGITQLTRWGPIA